MHSVEDWRELLTAVIWSKWPARSPSTDTKRAERGLGIRGNPYYFYVMRTHDAYGFVVFLVEDVGQIESATRDVLMGASPFDSGGLWKGKIHPLVDGSSGPTAEELEVRRHVFRNSEVPLDSWSSEFSSYLERNYSEVSDYVRGLPPSYGTPPISNTRLMNEERAWTWEVRYPITVIPHRLQLRCVCMQPDDVQDYRSWLADKIDVGKLSSEQANQLTDWVNANVVVSEKPPLVVESLLEAKAIE